ncbi:MAG: hypothetical protein GY830_02860 [Bacteroidetes bacterium]|nr:hypothetical protein [Bacteroidota bacterium]
MDNLVNLKEYKQFIKDQLKSIETITELDNTIKNQNFITNTTNQDFYAEILETKIENLISKNITFEDYKIIKNNILLNKAFSLLLKSLKYLDAYFSDMLANEFQTKDGLTDIVDFYNSDLIKPLMEKIPLEKILSDNDLISKIEWDFKDINNRPDYNNYLDKMLKITNDKYFKNSSLFYDKTAEKLTSYQSEIRREIRSKIEDDSETLENKYIYRLEKTLELLNKIQDWKITDKNRLNSNISTDLVFLRNPNDDLKQKLKILNSKYRVYLSNENKTELDQLIS